MAKSTPAEEVNGKTSSGVVQSVISQEEINSLKEEFQCLIGLKIDWLSLPPESIEGFEPSQIAVIVNTLLDAAMPQIKLLGSQDDEENIKKLGQIGLSKAPRLIGERESFPDYIHTSGKRLELKGLFVDNAELNFKRPPTQREPSARLKENVKIEQIQPDKDILLIAAVQLKLVEGKCYPVIIDIGMFPMYDCIKARDERLINAGGKWFGNLAKVISNEGRKKIGAGAKIENLAEEDFEKDTNFGKLKRIPYKPLQDFMRKHGVIV